VRATSNGSGLSWQETLLFWSFFGRLDGIVESCSLRKLAKEKLVLVTFKAFWVARGLLVSNGDASLL
jgi:hypothetical protein